MNGAVHHPARWYRAAFSGIVFLIAVHELRKGRVWRIGFACDPKAFSTARKLENLVTENGASAIAWISLPLKCE